MDLGVQELQMLGVRYYLAFTDKAVSAAQANPDLEEIDSAGVWHMFLVSDTDVVEPLRYSPVVYDNVDETQDDWLQPGVAWFKDPAEYEVLRAASGPDEWPRYTVPEDLKLEPEQLSEKRAEAQAAGETYTEPTLPAAPRVELPQVAVSNVSMARESLEFDVDQVGVPVLVKVSYFPNWKADGADGPYRVTPNLMVVVPTDTHVRLHYGYTGIDYVSYGLTFLGIALLVVLFRLRPGWPLGPIDDAPQPAPQPVAFTAPAPPADAFGSFVPGRAPPPDPASRWGGAPPPDVHAPSPPSPPSRPDDGSGEGSGGGPAPGGW
jgi:hypothetical protein